jgi:hypothetical protein
MRDCIDFISSYCDGWCERCAFTMRCSVYSVRVATDMCDGDVKAAIELAVGAPPPRDEADKRQKRPARAFQAIASILSSPGENVKIVTGDF